MHRFQKVSSSRAQEHHQQVACELEVEGVQVDEAHSKRRPKQVEWIRSALALGSLFILWVAFGPRNTDTAAYLIAQVVARLVDTLGLVLAVVVHAADLADRDEAKLVLQQLLLYDLFHRFPRLQRIWADNN